VTAKGGPMSNNSNIVEKTLRNVSNDIRDRVMDITSKVREDALNAKESVTDTLEWQRAVAKKSFRNFRRKATRFYRQHPAESVAIALAAGFLIGRFRSSRRSLLS
jgi:ElaB/YqjD/DUF883 family membrane-anchored ribosome-binding protein